MEFRRNKGGGYDYAANDSILFPPLDLIPTVHTIINDPILFRTFIRCLSTTATLLSSSSSDQSNPIVSSLSSALNVASTSSSSVGGGGTSVESTSSASLVNRNNRKRSMSLSVETSAKNMKFTNAFAASPTAMSTSRSTVNTSGSNISLGKPIFNVPVFVATILYSVLEYYDHWPAPLVQAYADDSFGPRVWVDHKLCILLTANLSLVHDDQIIMNELPRTSTACSDEERNLLLMNASIVAETFRNFQRSNTDTHDLQQKPTMVSSVKGKRGINVSQPQPSSSQSSFNFSRNNVQQQPTSSRQRTKTKPVGDVSSIDSETDEDALSVVPSNTMATYGDESSEFIESSELYREYMKRKRSTSIESTRSFEFQDYEEDQDSDTMEQQHKAPMDSAEIPSRHKSNTNAGVLIEDAYCGYPVEQIYIRSKRIRNRYYGKNLEAAHDAVVVSLQNRLNVKSKQNSSLLHCLPSFLGIPGVRSLVAAQLDKWLQSPALAGLARSLFSSTVNHIATIDPPLPEDILVIESIVGMKLKSNQVRHDFPPITS
jgi:hypothetical protein